MNLLKKVECLKNEYDAIEITDIDATGVAQERAVYFFDKRYSRRGNVFLELWQNEQKEQYSFIFKRDLLTVEENEEVDKNRRPTANRGTLYRYNMDVNNDDLYWIDEYNKTLLKLEDLWLKFSIEDIKYVLVPTEGERKAFISFIEDCGSILEKPEIISKLICLDDAAEDF